MSDELNQVELVTGTTVAVPGPWRTAADVIAASKAKGSPFFEADSGKARTTPEGGKVYQGRFIIVRNEQKLDDTFPDTFNVWAAEDDGTLKPATDGRHASVAEAEAALDDLLGRPSLERGYPADNPVSRLDAAHQRLDAAATPAEREAAQHEIDLIRNGIVGVELSGTDGSGTTWVI